MIKEYNERYNPLIKGIISSKDILTKKTTKYINCIASFDIETTAIPAIEQSIMYIWQFSLNNELVLYGRTWEDYFKLLAVIKESLDDNYLVCYVHNLSYEFQFLSGLYHFESDEVMIVRSRKILKLL